MPTNFLNPCQKCIVHGMRPGYELVFIAVCDLYFIFQSKGSASVGNKSTVPFNPDNYNSFNVKVPR